MDHEPPMVIRIHPAPAPNDRCFLPAEETVFDRTARWAIETFQVPIALIVLRESSGDRVAARAGSMSPVETRQGPQLCARIIDDNRPVAIADTTRAASSSQCLWMLEGHRIHCFAGYPIRNDSGNATGALVLMDRRTRHFSEGDLNELGELTRSLEDHIAHLSAENWGRRGIVDAPQTAPSALRDVVDDLDLSEAREPDDEGIRILVVEIDTPAEIEAALGPRGVAGLNQRVGDQVSLITRSSDVIDHAPQGSLMLFIHGGEQAVRRVAGRVSSLLEGSRLGIPPDMGARVVPLPLLR